MESTVYDYAIIGAGAAGLQLALAFAEDPYFNTKEILVIEKIGKKELGNGTALCINRGSMHSLSRLTNQLN